MTALISDLIRIGVVLGLDVAERIYQELRDEPRTAQGDRVDWTEIRAAILRQKAEKHMTHPRVSAIAAILVASQLVLQGLTTCVEVSTAAELMTALTGSYDTIYLAPGKYVGNFTVARKVTLVGVRGLVPGARVAPADVASVELVPADRLKPVLTVSASDVAVRGLTLRGGQIDRDTVLIGSTSATDIAVQPARVSFDQVAVLADPAGGHRGLFVNTGPYFRVTNSHIDGYVEQGRDSQGILVLNASGPFLFDNNFIAASGENILFGGSSIKIPNLVPADATITRNTLYKPDAWRQKPGSVKNSFEVKCGRRILFEDNVIDGNWKDAQEGSTLLLTARNQYGDTPWCLVDAITIRRNVGKRMSQAFAISILGHDDKAITGQTQTIDIVGNYFPDATNGIRVHYGVCQRLTITDNTFPAIKGNWLYYVGRTAAGTPLGCVTPTTLQRNVFASGSYGVFGEGVSPGVPALKFWSGGTYTMTDHVIERSPVRPIPYPPGQLKIVDSPQLLGLLDTDGHYIAGGAGW